MDDLSCKHRWANKGSVPWHPRESRSPCKNAVNDSTIASSISWWQGWHLFHCISPMSLQDGKNLYRQTTVGYWFCMFVTNSLSRRTLLQINFAPGHRRNHLRSCKHRWWCLPPSNGTFSSKQLANQLLPDSVRFLVAKNILEPIQRSQAQMKECVVEFVHQRHPPLHGFRMHSLHGLSGRTHLHIQILYATCLCTKILFVVNCCHVQRCGRCRRVSFNTKTHNRLASSLASSFENRM